MTPLVPIRVLAPQHETGIDEWEMFSHSHNLLETNSCNYSQSQHNKFWDMRIGIIKEFKKFPENKWNQVLRRTWHFCAYKQGAGREGKHFCQTPTPGLA